MPAEGRENPLLKKGNSDAFFREKYLTKNTLLLICLAPDVQPEDVEQMAEYAPAKLIISRESFVDDTAMANAHYILKDHGVELKLV